jgi:hypothetical protein
MLPMRYYRSNGAHGAGLPARKAPGRSAPPMTLGNAAKAGVRLIVWCKKCQHQVEPDPTEMVARYGADVSVIDWKERLVCSACGSRDVDMC